MNLLDFIILILIALQIRQWARHGFTRGAFSLIGFWVGIIMGALLAPQLTRLTEDPISRILLVLACIFGMGVIIGEVGKYIGFKLAHLTERLKLKKLDSVLGAIFGTVVTLFSIWLLSSLLSGSPSLTLNRQISDSKILHALNRTLPPAPNVINRVTALIRVNEFPEVFIGPRPETNRPVNPANSAEVASAIKAARAAVVKIESPGCGGVVNGSGFIAGNNLVVTNAHVVAGITQIFIREGTEMKRAEAVYFNPSADIAVLRVNNLANPPLKISAQEYPRATRAAVLGYPGGGSFVGEPAGILESFTARGRDIYGQNIVLRPVYELQTEIIEGNSGGPLVLPNGTVIGVIFAKSDTARNVGYALRTSVLNEALAKARQNQTVSTHSCTP